LWKPKIVQWQFLKLADKASSTKERGEFLKLAFMATLTGENAFASDEAAAECQEHGALAHQKLEEAQARWEAEERGAEITTYRTKDRDTPD